MKCNWLILYAYPSSHSQPLTYVSIKVYTMCVLVKYGAFQLFWHCSWCDPIARCSEVVPDVLYKQDWLKLGSSDLQLNTNVGKVCTLRDQWPAPFFPPPPSLSALSQTTPIYDLDLHFVFEYTLVKFHHNTKRTSVAVPATKCVSKSTFCHDFTHKQSHKMKPTPAQLSQVNFVISYWQACFIFGQYIILL